MKYKWQENYKLNGSKYRIKKKEIISDVNI